MDDLPYTTPDEDPFHALPPPAFFHLQRRPSSLLDKWIQEQRDELDDLCELPAPPKLERDASRASTPTHAYLAYPDLGRLSLEEEARDEVNSLYSYDLVDDDDLPNATIVAPVPEAPVTPRLNKQQPKPLLTSSPFRNLNLSFRPTSHPIGLSSAPDDTPTTPSPRTSSRMSIFTRSSRQSTCTLATVNTTPSKHARSSSLSTLSMSPSRQAPASSSKWRPSVLGHFSQSSLSVIPADTVYNPPRPSLSSGDTYTSGTSPTQTGSSIDSDLPTTPSKLSFFESIRTKNRSSLSIFKPQNTFASSSSIWSPARSHINDIDEESRRPDCASSGDLTLPRRVPFSPKPGGHFDNLLDDDDNLEDCGAPPSKRESARSVISFSSSSTFSRVSFGSLGTRHHKKKKRLVISGVGVHETRKFEGVKRWCETFGEIRQITRVANGDLHIDFRRPEVADTVCRVRAKVFITGVGSVYLSWTTGDKR